MSSTGGKEAEKEETNKFMKTFINVLASLEVVSGIY